MGILNKLKPNLTDIDVKRLKPEQLIFFCKTQVIDKQICKLRGVSFNQELADEMEKPHAFYFIVKSNMEYDVVSGVLFEPFLKDNDISEFPESDKSKKCMQHYINRLK